MDYDGLKEKLNQLKIEDYIWLIYIGIIFLSWYSNSLERNYYIYKNEESKKKYRTIMIIIFSILSPNLHLIFSVELDSKEITTKIIHVGVGDISEADVMLASASNALILGFTVKEDSNALAAAEKEGVTIKKYDIIYQILEDIEQTMLSLLEPEVKEVELGKAEVRQVFTIGKTTKIAGCYVTEGKIVRSKDAKLIRDGEVVFEGAIDQLKRFKDDVKEVAQGFECGISFAKWNDIEVGDIIEVSTTEEVERKSL